MAKEPKSELGSSCGRGPKVPEFLEKFLRKLLFELSENITEDELKSIKFLLLKTLPRSKLKADMAMEFQRKLLNVEQSLSKEEVQALVFLCAEILDKDLSTVSSASDLFSLLMKQDRLSPEDPSLLYELLCISRHQRLIQKFDLHSQSAPAAGHVSSYRKLLFELSENITEDELKSIKFLLFKTLPRSKLKPDMNMFQLLLEMEKGNHLAVDNLDTLEKVIGDVCPSLKRKITQFKTTTGPITQETGRLLRIRSEDLSTSLNHQDEDSRPRRSSSGALNPEGLVSNEFSSEGLIHPSLYGGMELSAEVSSSNTSCQNADVEGLSNSMSLLGSTGSSLVQSHHVAFTSSPEDNNLSKADPNPSNSTNLAEYEMRGERRGFCLIINNFDFSKSRKAGTDKLKNREGTHFDEGRLKEVFKWLGFETHTEQDCTREAILSRLQELQKRDHSQGDCLVCCVLSHGKEGTVYGVDGHQVRLRELTEPFTGHFCPSLVEKPKLFFIQACQGIREQQVVFVQSDGPGSGQALSDAAVPNESIPTDADFLLGMATVADFASFRDRKQGTWFIQSLCNNLVQLVPRGHDLLSILTKVNDDVSKMTDSAGIKKQMPQPEFTLRKKVVFPIPKGEAPKNLELK